MSKQQAALWEYRQSVAAWKEGLVSGYDDVDQVILQLAEGRPERIKKYRWNHTHTAIIEAYISKLTT